VPERLGRQLDTNRFEEALERIVRQLSKAALAGSFSSAASFEAAARQASVDEFGATAISPTGNGQGFPDIAVGKFGIEVKFTEGPNWRCVANSVLESDRRAGVEKIYVLYGKMGGRPEVRWRKYEDTVMHVRTSHVPRFEIDMEAHASLFQKVGVSYERFRRMEMHEKMVVIRNYAKSNIRGTNRRLWWIEDEAGAPHTLPPDIRLYTSLETPKKLELRAEAAFISPCVVGPSRIRGKYDDAATYLLTYHGVLCTQVRDLFSAGSVAMRSDRSRGGLYIDRALQDIAQQFLQASLRVPDSVIEEYWGVPAPKRADRIKEWLRLADKFAVGWRPSETLFRNLT
jgi:hypothetical protein